MKPPVIVLGEFYSGYEKITEYFSATDYTDYTDIFLLIPD